MTFTVKVGTTEKIGVMDGTELTERMENKDQLGNPVKTVLMEVMG